MIRHCVFIDFEETISQSEQQSLFNEIQVLRANLDGVVSMHFGDNVSPEAGMDKDFSAGFIIDFDNAEHRDAYLHDENHKKVAAKLVAAACGGADGILVFDMQL